MKLKFVLVSMLASFIVAVGLAGGWLWFSHSRMTPEEEGAAVLQSQIDAANAAPAGGLTDYWKVPAFDYIDQDGKHVTDRDLIGHPWITDFFYSQCTTACPILTARLRMLENRISDPSVRFISFSVDPAHDTPAVLKAYAQLWHGDESRWRLLATGSEEALHQTTSAMHVAAQHSDNPNIPIIHSNQFFLVDAAGEVRGMYDSTDEDAMKKLMADVETLLPSSVMVPGAMAGYGNLMGEQLFSAAGCMACHSRPPVAPPLAGLAGSLVKLDGGTTVLADAAYLREAIVNPNTKIIAGYLPTMPGYRGLLSDGQVDSLVDYLQTLKADAATTAAAEPVAIVMDPVCRMQVRADPAGPHAMVGGKMYYFCSDTCREKFLINPGLYLHAVMPTTAATQMGMPGRM
jgi:protein SCO1/2